MAKGDVTEPHLTHGIEGSHYLGLVFKEGEGLLHRHGKDIVYVLAPVCDLQDIVFKTSSTAVRTGDKDIGEKLHLYLFKSFTPAGLATARSRVKGKMGGSETPCAGRGCLGQKAAERVQGLGVGQWIGPGGPPYGPLVHQHSICYMFHAVDGPVVAGTSLRVPLCPFDGLIKDFFGQGRLARTRYSCQTNKKAQRDPDVYLLEVVDRGPLDHQPSPLARTPPTLRQGNSPFSLEIPSGKGTV